MIVFLLLHFIVFWAHAAIPTCLGTIPFNIPQNEPFVTWYPNNFTNTNPPLYPDNYKCEYMINVPQGWSVRVELIVNVTNPSGTSPPVRVIDQFQNTEYIKSADREYFFFIANGGRIQLNTMNGKIQFGFKVDWKQYDQEFSPSKLHVNQTDILPEILTLGPHSPMIVTADTRVSITTITPNYDFYWMYFRSVLIYDGPNWNCSCLGTAYQLFIEKTQFVSTGKEMTIQFLAHEQVGIKPLILLQDYENTKKIVQFQGVACRTGENCGVYSMDASKGPVAVQTIYEGNYAEIDVLTEFDGSGTLEVYMGQVTKNKKNVIAAYDTETSDTYLPQKFIAPLKTYVLTKGHAKINITRDSNEFRKTKKFGRKGFMASTYYTFLYNMQFAGGEIQAPNGYSDANFKLKILFADMSGNANAEITGLKNGIKTFDQNFNSTFQPDLNSEIDFHGDTFTAYYSANGELPPFNSFTRGFFMTFEVLSNTGASGILPVPFVLCLILNVIF